MTASDPDHKASVEAALDLLVYAPLGLALEARTLMPTLIERGRNQVTMARMVGRFAVQQGQVEATRRLGSAPGAVRGRPGRPGCGAPAPGRAGSPPDPGRA